jgi:DNA-binding YbaB/EbfC family protein
MFGGLGNLNPQKFLQKMQEDMARIQEELDAERLETSTGGGMVKVVTSGMGEIISVQISPEVVDPSDVETLQDLVTVAVRDAVKKAQEHHQEKMGAVTNSLPKIPGLTM